jgi:hypothetical protein
MTRADLAIIAALLIVALLIVATGHGGDGMPY